MRKTHCVLCGKPFPEGTVASKHYCDECRILHDKELEENRKARRRLRAIAASIPQQEPRQPKMLQKEDIAYCAKCVFRGRFSAGYLCNYVLLTGARRGCKYGVGCTKREIGAAKGEVDIKQCDRCGASYIGGPSSHYCPECRANTSRENARKAHQKNKVNRDGREEEA